MAGGARRLLALLEIIPGCHASAHPAEFWQARARILTLTMTPLTHTWAGPYSAGNTAKPVNFYCCAPQAKSVFLVGDFNGWNHASHPMERRVDGWWFLQVELPHGHHQYRFLVDGKPMLDPRATGTAVNERKEEVSLLALS